MTEIRRIFEVKGPAWLYDEITREEDPAGTGALIEKTSLAYISPTDLHEKSILDFGCRAGSSTMNLSHLCACALKAIKYTTNICYVPDLELAIRKGANSRSP